MVTLSRHYVITDGAVQMPDEILGMLERCLQQGYRLFQLRAKSLAAAHYRCLAVEALALTKHYQALLLLNNISPAAVIEMQADGVHLTSQDLLQLQSRPLPMDKLVAASCHSQAQLRQAAQLGVDFVTLSPVLATRSHPKTAPLGWVTFSNLCMNTQLRVYALGGMQLNDLPQIMASGGYGMAGISAFCDTGELTSLVPQK